MDYKLFATKIIVAVGGNENIENVVHCATRLRFNLINKEKVDLKAIEAAEGVRGTMFRTNQLQLIMGSGVVNKAYDAVMELVNSTEQGHGKKKPFSIKSLGSMFLDTLSTIFAPVIPIIVGTGLLMGILYILPQMNLVDNQSATYKILNTFANSSFYFLPIYLGFSSAKKFGCNQFVGALLGAILVHPNIVGIATSGENVIKVFGMNMTIVNYSSSVLPVILTVYFASWVQKGLKRIVPDMFDVMLVPIGTIIISGLVSLFILAPLGSFAGNFFADGMMSLYNSYGLLGGLLFAGLRPFILATGMNIAFVPISIMSLESVGFDVIFPMSAASNAAMATSALYVFLKTRNKETKAFSGSSALSGYIGVTEPALFGFVLKYRNALISTIAGGAIGGAIMGFFQVKFAGMGLVPFGGIMLAFGPTFGYYLLGVGVSIIVTFSTFHFLGFKDDNELDDASTLRSVEILSPVSGECISLSETSDPTFAQELVGKGIAVIPTTQQILSPVNGKIVSTFKSKHAIGIETDDGIELLIHVGIDTVKMDGVGFKSHVEEGQYVATGDPLIDFDISSINEAGYDTTVFIVVTNHENYTIQQASSLHSKINVGENLLSVTIGGEH